MIVLYQVNKLKKSLLQDAAGIVIAIKDYKEDQNYENDKLDNIFINDYHELLGVAKLYS